MPPPALPKTFDELVRRGGPEEFARAAARHAAQRERALWLAALEQMQPGDAADVMMRDLYIQDLRRKLGLRQPLEVVRAQNRERVRRLRARRKADAGKRA